MKENNIDFYSKTSLKAYNLDESIRYQLNMLDSLDVFTRKHSENVANITCRLCERLKLNKNFIVYCTVCAYLHDIGKLFIPSSILQKNGPLTDEEYEVIKTHTTLGYNMCMDDLNLRPYANGALYHHEALNGSGYPNHVTEKDLPLEGQIIRVADEFDAIVSKRQYKSHIGITDTLNILVGEAQENPKSQKLNPQIVKALLKVVIEDTEYEISCLFDYIKHINKQIQRLELVREYNLKMQNATKEKKKEYFKACVDSLLEERETPENFICILEEYSAIHLKKKEQINKLFNEINEIKKIKI